MISSSTGIVKTVMDLAIFDADWVLWLLIGLSVVSVAIMIERIVFYSRHKIDIDAITNRLSAYLDAGDLRGAGDMLAAHDSLETNVVLFGLKAHRMGPESVEDRLMAARDKEKARYDQRLNILATIAAIAPFLGLFGTVLGIIHAFQDLAQNMNEASASVMAGIAEALSTTAVGLLVAIPAVIAYNIFKDRVAKTTHNLQLLAGILTANLKAITVDASTTDEEEG